MTADTYAPARDAPFADHFSAVAAQYANSRPRYPERLFALLAARSPRRELVWDAGCGSGQASVGLASYFAHVVANDPSAEQIAHADVRENISYAVAGETNPLLRDASVDLVTVAQALHWFNRPAFYREVQRVLRPDGLLAVWTYEQAVIDPAVDAVIAPWYRDTLGPYWPAERALVEARYETIGFPYVAERVLDLEMRLEWSRDQLVAYLGTWSAVKRYREQVRRDPLDLVLSGLVNAWPHNEVREVRWPLTVVLGGPAR